ncbi:c-type cytochrome [Desulfitobacterium sp. Sab5]|uniref:c-type cytochrome n=1 Tax=Desulfitobacterium nosdiversum TaxID=3375356 RepID=UPI003CEC801F
MLKKTLVILGLFSFIVVGGCNKQAPAPTNPSANPVPSQSAQTPSTTTPAPPNGPSTPPVTNQPAATQANGSALYTSNCAGCHGAGGAGGSGPAINTDEWKNNSGKVQSIVKNGKGSMPGFASSLNDTQVKAIGDYVASLKK